MVERSLADVLEAVAKVRAIHARNTHSPYYCRNCRGPWPCRTIRALDGEAVADG